MPAPEILLDQHLCFGGTPRACLVRKGRYVLALTGVNQLIAPTPAFLNFFSADEEGLIALDSIKEESLVRIRDAVQIAAFPEVQIE
jgi:hypothetical protein